MITFAFCFIVLMTALFALAIWADGYAARDMNRYLDACDHARAHGLPRPNVDRFIR